MQLITSIKDPRILLARELTTAKSRITHQACLLEGIEQIEWVLNAKIPIEFVILHDKLSENPFIAKIPEDKIYWTSEGILKKATETNYLVPVIAIASTKNLFRDPEGDFVVMLDNLHDHGNIGTIIRTATAFGIHDVVFNTPARDIFFKKTIDASRGTIFKSNLVSCDTALDAVRFLKSKNYQIVATSPYGSKIQSIAQLEKKPVALVVGNETHGCSEQLLQEADLIVQIPMNSAVESLNVAIAAGISIYELQLKVIIAMIQQKIEDRIGRTLSITVELIHQALDKELSKVSEFTAQQLILLMILVFDRETTLKQITYDIGAGDQDLSNLLEPLIKQGYLSRQDTNIMLLPAGEELIAKLWPLVHNTEQKILDGFSSEEKIMLDKLLKRIQQNCTQLLKN